MIRNMVVKSDIARQWVALRTLCLGSHRSSGTPVGFINETPPEEFYNLPFVLAYAVLDQVLDELIDQGAFKKPRGRRPMLGAKMTASAADLQWTDYDLVAKGKDARNDPAHEAKLLAKADCFRFVDAVESELKAWGVIRAGETGEYRRSNDLLCDQQNRHGLSSR